MNGMLFITIVMLTGWIRAESSPESEESSESSIEDADDAEDNSKKYNLMEHSEEISNSTSVSDEHPLEYYQDNQESNNKLRSLRSSCYRKVQRFCKKACKKAYRDACYEYRCGSGFRRTIRRACKDRCRTYY
ncbi:hypothetical protein evm_010384 [Chilo suppressalis]|nr:hypothetical protein evm_010384 [Chilo suppressalis]